MPEKIKYAFSMDSAVPIGTESIEAGIVNKVHIIKCVEQFPQQKKSTTIAFTATVEDRIKEFEKFYYFLIKNAPENYKPWFFPCDKNGKNPSPLAIMKNAPQKSLCCDTEWVFRITKEEEKQIEANPNLKVKPSWRCDKCEKAKGSWHGEHARLNKEQVIEHLKQGWNIGISARTGDPLIIGDIDEEEYLNQIPENTLVVTSRKRAGVHFFGWDKDGTAKINLPTDGGEIRSDNQYVLACGSYVPFNLNSKKEKIAYDKLPEYAREDKLQGYYTMKESFHPREMGFNDLPKFFREKEEENIEAEAKIENNNEKKEFKGEGKYSELFNLKVSDIVGLIPANKRKGHPLHESDTDANFSLSKDGSLAHCWRHLVSLNAVQYLCVKVGYKSCVDCGTPHKNRGISKIKGDKKALEVAYKEAVKLGLIEEYKTPDNKKVEILLDGGYERNISDVCRDIADIFKDKNTIFYNLNSKQIVEIGRIILHNSNEEVYTGFREMKDKRFITLLEKFATCGEMIKHKEFGTYFSVRSLSAAKADIILCSEIIENAIPQIQRIFNYQLPVIYEGELTFPSFGYDKRFNSWLSFDSPKISNENMSLEEAKENIEKILKEFCFKGKQDKINAIAGMLTPFLNGLFPNFNDRTPVFFYEGNRERSGKDYCAGITGIIYEGKASEESPISTGEKGAGGKNEELRKKITSALIGGKKRLHFSNNKGFINNAVFESLITNKYYTDRLLGKNENVNMPNELYLSLSGNAGITYTADLANRCRFIRFLLEIEDANKREFENPNLHEWVLNNREDLLSSFYALVKNWFEKDKPKGTVPFTSFPEWADICGGIMETAGYDSPCTADTEIFSVGGDSETNDMKRLFEICYEAKPNQWILKKEIKDIFTKSKEEIFPYLDFERKSDQIKFGSIIEKFVWRIFSDIKLSIRNPNERPARRLYQFGKNTFDDLGVPK